MGFGLTLLLRIGLVVALDAVALASLAFSPANPLLVMLSHFLCPRYPLLAPLALFLVVLLLGLLWGVFGRREGWYSLVVLFLCLPAALPFSAMDWPRLLGLELAWGRGNLIAALAAFTFVGAGYLSLHYVRWLREVALGLLERGAEPKEVQTVYLKSHLGLAAVIAFGMLSAGLVGGFSIALERPLRGLMALWSLSVLIVGTLCCLLFLVGFYLLIRSRLAEQDT